MRQAPRIGPPALERAVDELARRADRFEVYAKAGETLDWRHRHGGTLEHRRIREVGVACRAFAKGTLGFAAAAGSAAVSGRDASRAALANLLPGSDPLPPRHLLGAVAVPTTPGPADPQACEAFLTTVERRLRRPQTGVELVELRLLAGSSQTTLVTGEGFSARAASTGCVVEILLGAREGPLRLFQPAARSLDEFDPEALAAAAIEATLLTARGGPPIHRLTDVLLAPPVAAAVVAALADFVFRGGLDGGARTVKVAPAWNLADRRAGPEGLLPLPFDGEGMPSNDIAVAAGGRLGGRLVTWAGAQHAAGTIGGAVRPSYQQPPRPAPANLVFSATEPTPASEMLKLLGDGIYCPLCAGPLRVAGGRFALPAAALEVRHGRPAAAHPVVELRGTFRRLLGGLAAAGGDTQGFSLSCGVTTPSLLFRKLEVA